MLEAVLVMLNNYFHDLAVASPHAFELEPEHRLAIEWGT